MEVQEPMPGVIVKPLSRRQDARGVLTELFRGDELPEGFRPVMSYLSVTHPGIARGPHEHADQTDGFAFIDGAYDNFEGHCDWTITPEGEAVGPYPIVAGAAAAAVPPPPPHLLLIPIRAMLTTWRETKACPGAKSWLAARRQRQR